MGRPRGKGPFPYEKIGARVREVRLRAGFGAQEAFAAALGVPKSSYADTESGKQRPSQALLEKLAERYGVRADELLISEGLQDDDRRELLAHFDALTFPNRRRAVESVARIRRDQERTTEVEPTDPRSAPLQLFRIAASEEGIEPLGTGDTFPNPGVDARRHFALLIEGESMSGDDIHTGDVILVKSTTELAPNKIMVLVNTVKQEGTLKRAQRTDDGYLLKPSNPSEKSFKWDRHTRIRGAFVRVLRKGGR